MNLRMKNRLPLFLLALLGAACSTGQPDPEVQAARMLAQARALLQQKDYAAARDTVTSMRRTWPTAFKARTTGIVVMDSIELCEAQDTLALLDEQLRLEQQKLTELQNRDNRGRNQEYYDQKNKVFYLQQHVDEICAKVKFYFRKIDIDSKELK